MLPPNMMGKIKEFIIKFLKKVSEKVMKLLLKAKNANFKLTLTRCKEKFEALLFGNVQKDNSLKYKAFTFYKYIINSKVAILIFLIGACIGFFVFNYFFKSFVLKIYKRLFPPNIMRTIKEPIVKHLKKE